MLGSSLLAGLIAGASGRWIAAAAAFESPPICPAAGRYRSVALGLFLASAALLLAAALVDTVAGVRPTSEFFGWSGIGCLQACVFCGIRYSAVNKKYADGEWDLA